MKKTTKSQIKKYTEKCKEDVCRLASDVVDEKLSTGAAGERSSHMLVKAVGYLQAINSINYILQSEK